MPKRTDIKKILIIGSGPIIIGQGCEFDYSGTQACKVLRQEGFEIVLVNSNPATIMTDPEMAHRTYVEPLTPEILERYEFEPHIRLLLEQRVISSPAPAPAPEPAYLSASLRPALRLSKFSSALKTRK